MTEQEAIATLFQQCAPPTGFLVRLRQGQGFDQQGVQQLWEAFDTLQQVWSERTCVPREAVLALAYFDEVLLQVMFEQYPQHEDELFELQMALVERLPACSGLDACRKSGKPRANLTQIFCGSGNTGQSAPSSLSVP
jgi:hypothetical protein